MNIKNKNDHGVLGLEYAEGRNKKKALKYRLLRRTHEVKSSIKIFSTNKPSAIIDLGTAEGKMLNDINKIYPECKCVGVEYDNELATLATKLFPNLKIYQGDVQKLNQYLNEKFDVAIATAIIEHVLDPQTFINEIKKILKPNGILIITAPDPFWEFVASKVGHLDDEAHREVPNIKRIEELIHKSGMVVLHSKKFMLSPIGMPGEFIIENFLRKLKLNFLMANQLIVAKNN